MTRIFDQNRVHFGDDVTDIGQLRADVGSVFLGTDLGAQRTIFVVSNMRQSLGCVAFGVSEGLDFGIIEKSRITPEVEDRFAENGACLIDAGSGASRRHTGEGQVQPGRVTVLTSGTTGLLKLISHTPRTLNTFERVQSLPQNTWFLPFQIGSYAWYQMVALCLFKEGQDLVPGDFTDLAGSFGAALRRGHVTAISSTPTFWRYALMSIDEALLRTAPLRNLSLGGEIVDQPVLDRLSALYPNARIRHIYASSEAGAAIVVSDGKAGFDARLTERDDATIGVKVEKNRLYIRSPYANSADADAWVDTGDLVERRGDRFVFLGRAGNTMINVGGQKAFPADIEAYLMSHPRVVWARVTARRAPLMGALPVASVVLRQPMSHDEAERMLTAYCEAGLAEYAVPRIWDFHDHIPMQASLKS